MALLIDPRNGDKYEFPDENADAARERFGVVSPEEYAEQQRRAELQAQHGTLGEELRTGAESAFQTLGNAGAGIAKLVGDEAASKPIQLSAEQQARQEANPTATTVGKVAGALPLYAALGGAAAAAGGAAAGALGASETLGAAAGLGTEAAVTGAAQEQQESNEQGRSFDWWNAGKNGLINAGLGAFFPAAGAGYRAAFGEASPIEQTVQQTIERAANNGDDLLDPLVRARRAENLDSTITDTASRLQTAVEDARVPIAKNLQAQRDALNATAENVRGAAPEVADELESLAKLPAQRSFRGLQDLVSDNHGSEVAGELSSLYQDRALWGDQAVDHANALEAVRAAGSDPQKLVDAVSNIKDDTVSELGAKLSGHLDDKSILDNYAVFGDQGSTVGAATSNFNDTDWDAARTALRSGKKDALQASVTLSSESPAIIQDAQEQAGRALQHLDTTMKNELSLQAKYDDWETASKQWSSNKTVLQERFAKRQSEVGQSTVRQLESLKELGYNGKSYTSAARDLINDYARRMQGTDALTRAKMLDGLKRGIQAQIGRLSSMSENVLAAPVRERIIGVLQPFEKSLREGLEDPALWGAKVARYQKAANAAWHDGIPALGRIFRDLGHDEGVTWGQVGAAARIWKAEPERVGARLKQTLGGGTNFQEDLATSLETISRLIDAKEAHGIHVANLREAKASLEALKDSFDMASLVRIAHDNVAKAARAGGHEGASGGAALASSAIIHAAEFVARAHGFPIGNAIRAGGGYSKLAKAIDAVGAAFGKEKPLPFGEAGGPVENAVRKFADSSRRRLADLHQNNQYANEIVQGAPAYSDMLTSLGGGRTGGAPRMAPVPPPAAPPTGSALGNAGEQGFSDVGTMAGIGAAGLGGLAVYRASQDEQHAQYLAEAAARDTTATARAMSDPEVAEAYSRRLSSQPSTLEQFQGEHETIQQAFMAQKANVQKMLRDPEGMIDALSNAFGNLPPESRDQLSARALQIGQWLQSQLPPERGVSVTRPNGLPPSTLEARSYALKQMTALKPSTAFDDAKRGQLRHEQVDTLQANWPELYADLRNQTLEAFGNGRSSVVQRQRADLLFNFGSALDPAFSPRLSAAAAAARQKTTSGKPPSEPTATKLPAGLTPGGIQALNLGSFE